MFQRWKFLDNWIETRRQKRTRDYNLMQFHPIISFVLQREYILSTFEFISFDLEFGNRLPSSSVSPSFDRSFFFLSLLYFFTFYHTCHIYIYTPNLFYPNPKTDQNFTNRSQNFSNRGIDHNFFTSDSSRRYVFPIRFVSWNNPGTTLASAHGVANMQIWNSPAFSQCIWNISPSSSNSVGVCFRSNSFQLVGERKLRSTPGEIFRRVCTMRFNRKECRTWTLVCIMHYLGK